MGRSETATRPAINLAPSPTDLIAASNRGHGRLVTGGMPFQGDPATGYTAGKCSFF